MVCKVSIYTAVIHCFLFLSVVFPLVFCTDQVEYSKVNFQRALKTNFEQFVSTF